MLKDNDYELLYMIHTNDEYAFRYLFHKYEDTIRFIIYKYQKKHDRRYTIDDFMQLARIKLLQAIDNYQEDKDASFSYYFFEVFQRSMIDHYRTRYTQKGSFDYMTVSLDTTVSDRCSYYDSEKVQGEWNDYVSQRICDSIKHLNPVEQSIVDLRAQGFTYSQISEDLNIKKKKIDNTLRKLRKQKRE